VRWLCKNLRELGKVCNIIITENFVHVDFGLLKELVGRISWESALEGRNPRKFLDLQGQPPQSTRTVHPDVQDAEQV